MGIMLKKIRSEVSKYKKFFQILTFIPKIKTQMRSHLRLAKDSLFVTLKISYEIASKN